MALKKQQQADEKAAKEAEKKQQKEAEKKPKEVEKKPKEVEKKPKEAEKKPKEVEKEPEKETKKVTVKRITIEGKQYLKTSENLLYNPETKEEMGIYDPVTNTIKELPNDSEDELSEDEYETEA